MRKAGRRLNEALKRYELVPVIVSTSDVGKLVRITGGRHIGFNLVSALMRVEDVEALDDVGEVDRVLIDRRVGIPELPEYEMLIDLISVDRPILSRIMSLSLKKREPKKFHDTMSTAKMLNADQAWKEGILGRVKVAVIDSDAGLNVLSHPQIMGGATMYCVRRALRGATNGHGTHVGTTIGGNMVSLSVGGRSANCIGIAPGSSLIFIKSLLTPMGFGMTSDIIEGIYYAVKLGARVINMSLGGEPEERKEDDPLCIALSQVPKDVIVCVASGNNGKNYVGSPAYCNNVLAINAMDPSTGEKADFSQYGKESAFLMPGVDIFSGVATGSLLDILGRGVPGYSSLSGTSMATPHASGMVALYIEYFDKLGYRLTRDDFIRIGESYGEKFTEERGYGPLYWDYAKKYAKDLNLI